MRAEVLATNQRGCSFPQIATVTCSKAATNSPAQRCSVQVYSNSYRTPSYIVFGIIIMGKELPELACKDSRDIAEDLRDL
jgi:hypothetical protein